MIGDFTWTGWDYLGRGRDRPHRLRRTWLRRGIPSPSWASTRGARPGAAIIDITGHRRPQSYYREIVFGLRADPYLAVQRPEHHGKVAAGTPWSWGDVVSSWSWAGHEGAPVTVEVYADADEVELVVNGRSVGRQPSGATHRYRSDVRDGVRTGPARGRRLARRDRERPHGAPFGHRVGAARRRRRPPRHRRRSRRPGLRDPHSGRRATERSTWRATGESTCRSTGPACSRPWAVRTPPPRRASPERVAPRSTVAPWPSSGRRARGGSPLRATAEGCEAQQVVIDARA